MSYDYKKAEELREAGYPPIVPKGEFYFEWIKYHTYCPNTDQLLMACKNNFRSLEREDGGWIATHINKDGAECVNEGDDPTEAMANCWLDMALEDLVRIDENVKKYAKQSRID